MIRRTMAFATAVTLATVAPPGLVLAAPASTGTDVRADAAERFDRGLRLFNQGDNAGALVEFRRAYELVENVLVLYNIGLVYAQMGRAVDATDALNRVLAGAKSLSPERIALAQKTRDEQAARIAEVVVTANVDGAGLEVDGLEVEKTPLHAPLRVTSGTHVIGVIAAGYSPQRKEIAIASRETQSVAFDLVAMQGRLAHLAVKTHLPGADLFVDDQRIAGTPLSASVSLPPGRHRIELRREGYVTASGEVALGDGAVGEITLEAQEDPAALASSRSAIALDATETFPVVSIDGRSRGVYTAPIRVLPGVHRIVAARGDFVPFERSVTADPGRTTTVRVVFEPTPEYRTQYASRASTQRTWGIVSVIGGAVALAGGTGLLIYDAGKRSDGVATRNSILALGKRGEMKLCDPAGDTLSSAYITGCTQPFNAANAQIDDANTRDYVGWGGVGLGAAGAVLGVVLLVTADDPHRYDEKPSTEHGLSWTGVPTFWATPKGSGVAWGGTF